MGDDRITLHFPEADSAVTLSTLQRLSRELIDGSVGSHLGFVAHLAVNPVQNAHHMSQSLVVNHADVDVRFQQVAPDARIQRLAAVIVEPRRLELLAEVVHRALLLAELERRGVLRGSWRTEGEEPCTVRGARPTCQPWTR